eukprot:19382-Heterococcus_DN1.PRE.5
MQIGAQTWGAAAAAVAWQQEQSTALAAKSFASSFTLILPVYHMLTAPGSPSSSCTQPKRESKGLQNTLLSCSLLKHIIGLPSRTALCAASISPPAASSPWLCSSQSIAPLSSTASTQLCVQWRSSYTATFWSVARCKLVVCNLQPKL